MRKYIQAALSITTIGLLFYTLFDLREQVKQIPVLQTQNDSLVNEVFRLQTELGRIQVTNNQVFSKYPKLYEEFNLYLETQTE